MSKNKEVENVEITFFVEENIETINELYRLMAIIDVLLL